MRPEGPGDPPTDPEGDRWREPGEDVDDDGAARRDQAEWLGPDEPVDGLDEVDEDDDADVCDWCGAEPGDCDCEEDDDA